MTCTPLLWMAMIMVQKEFTASPALSPTQPPPRWSTVCLHQGKGLSGDSNTGLKGILGKLNTLVLLELQFSL